jgi:phospholipase C
MARVIATGPASTAALRAARGVLAATALGALVGGGVGPTPAAAKDGDQQIEHLVVIFQENVSFDHYFATYPVALNPGGEPAFEAEPHTPRVDNLMNAGLLTPNNPNAVQPFRLGRSQADTCDQNHEYTAEQEAEDGGRMDKFVEFTGVGNSAAGPCLDYGHGPGLVMGYFDGNTVTALWNYAQRFAMSDNFFGTTFGPSTPGALNLISGQTHGVVASTGSLDGDVAEGSVIGDPQPFYDDCSTRETVAVSGENVGDLLNAKGVSWGWFQGGFRPSSVVNGKAKCDTAHTGADGNPKKDYIPHHEPFQYYTSTANPHHLPPSSVALIGLTDQANHQYDLADFWAAAAAGHLPAVSFLKAPGYQDGHAAYSSPLFEQQFLVETINGLQMLPEWNHTAVVITYDDSDGWYDHVPGPIVNHSQTAADAAICNGKAPLLGSAQGRCGYGPRLPLLVISPFAKQNFVGHPLTDQSSILRFIEDNWSLGRIGDHSYDQLAGPLLNLFDFGNPREQRLLLDPVTGQPTP